MKKFILLIAAFLLMTGYAYADYYNYGTWNFGYGSAYGVDGWVGGDGIDRIIFYAGSQAHIYQVTVAGNPHIHPLNPEAPGPAVLPRTFTLESSFALQYTNYGHECEFYVGSDRIYLGATNGIEMYSFSGAYLGKFGPNSPNEGGYSTQSLGYDAANNDWYAATIGFDATSNVFKLDGDNLGLGWTEVFSYGVTSHHDGLEVLANGNLLLADYNGQIAEYTNTGTFVANHLHDPWGHELEGMGSGALGHYWGGSHGGSITEFGGGSLPPPSIPEPNTVVLLCFGLFGLAGIAKYRRKK